MVDRVKAVIYLKHIWHNFELLQNVHNNKRVLAVVKGDAYGHGAVEVASYLEERGCNFFAVTDIVEAIELREAGIKSEILIFGKTSIENVSLINKYNLTQTLDSFDYAKLLNSEQITIQTHIIIDTGMNRFGLYCHRENDLLKTKSEIKDIIALEYIVNKGIYTHFAIADGEREDFTDRQYDMFNALIGELEEEGFDLGLKHCSNSAGVIKYKDRNMDMVRAGIALYGYPPSLTDLNFLPVMEVSAKVIAVRSILKNDYVSYGLSYKTNKNRSIASIAIGYADGYMRQFSNNDYFVFKGKKLNVVGTVCMGITMVDVTGIDISVGDYVEVFGLHKSLVEMAIKANTITYELLANMRKKRVHFEYKK